MIFNFYRGFDILLILYFLFLFPTNGVIPSSIAAPAGFLIAGLIGYRLFMSLIPQVPNNDSYVFDLVDCSHHHFSLREKEERINKHG